MSIMFDAVEIDQIPGDASAVAGYITDARSVTA